MIIIIIIFFLSFLCRKKPRHPSRTKKKKKGQLKCIISRFYRIFIAKKKKKMYKNQRFSFRDLADLLNAFIDFER